MNLNRAVLLLAGTITLISALLTALISPWWLLLTTFVGLNLMQSSITGFCPAATALRHLGLREGSAFSSKNESRETSGRMPQARADLNR